MTNTNAEKVHIPGEQVTISMNMLSEEVYSQNSLQDKCIHRIHYNKCIYIHYIATLETDTESSHKLLQLKQLKIQCSNYTKPDPRTSQSLPSPGLSAVSHVLTQAAWKAASPAISRTFLPRLGGTQAQREASRCASPATRKWGMVRVNSTGSSRTESSRGSADDTWGRRG